MKRLTAFICLILTLGIMSTSFVGCKKDKDSGTVMNVSLNPEVEFILDADGNVVSVNALNEEGNLIVSSVSFTGKSADEAVELFVKISHETGFLFEGQVKSGENELKVAFSGDEKQAKKLYGSVEEKVKEYFNEEKISASIAQGVAITQENLQALALECAPYIDQAKVQALSYAELIDTIAESRKETAEMYSQEVKKAYYEAKAFVMQQAEIEVLRSKLDLVSQGILDIALTVYEESVNAIEATRLSMLVAEDSPYQLALKVFQQAKIDYLKYREYVASLEQNKITEDITTRLNQCETALQSAETALLNAGQTANKALDTAKDKVKTAYDAVIKAIGDYSNLVKTHADAISAKVTESKAQFFTDFETAYKAQIDGAKQSWADMKASLEESANA